MPPELLGQFGGGSSFENPVYCTACFKAFNPDIYLMGADDNSDYVRERLVLKARARGGHNLLLSVDPR